MGACARAPRRALAGGSLGGPLRFALRRLPLGSLSGLLGGGKGKPALVEEVTGLQVANAVQVGTQPTVNLPSGNAVARYFEKFGEISLSRKKPLECVGDLPVMAANPEAAPSRNLSEHRGVEQGVGETIPREGAIRRADESFGLAEAGGGEHSPGWRWVSADRAVLTVQVRAGLRLWVLVDHSAWQAGGLGFEWDWDGWSKESDASNPAEAFSYDLGGGWMVWDGSSEYQLQEAWSGRVGAQLDLGLVERITDHVNLVNYFRGPDGLNVHKCYGYMVNERTGAVIADCWSG